MSATIQTYRIGQSVRLLPDIHLRSAAGDVYTVLACHESDSADPSYVIRSGVDNRQRRAAHSRLRPADGTASVFAEGPRA